MEFCVLSLKCRVLSRFVTRCVECRGGCVWVFLVGFFVVYSLVLQTGRITLGSTPDQLLEKPQVRTSLQMHATTHYVHSHTITPYKQDTLPTDQAIHYKKTYQEHLHTAPTTFNTPSNKPR